MRRCRGDVRRSRGDVRRYEEVWGPSCGSWRLMSSESKMGCRYIQLRWQPSHSEVTSCTNRSLRSQSAMRSSKGPLYGEKENCCVSTMWSSSSELTSSLILITPVPVLR